MGPVNWLGVALGTAGCFAVGALWYGVLFGKRWQREVGVSEPPKGAAAARIMGLTLLAEFVVVSMLAHLVARTAPAPHVVLMMAGGFGAAIIAPAIGINYLHQRRSLALFAIDAGHIVVGLLVAGLALIATA
ncbi:DUF1761 domain-containing protein [Novosphingobium flavum]|uniref:DUF1761 domain-containing protein n=1 Tax=Novosphingobium flavum TaxID=1778672 RepID=A0A7X1FUJ2_9SPHN|nr:DUF1761 domain-containing protein [Novosphingobium flavum]MBC2667236.1 DUF1761 domain-containing protein [Novosphingobium flavum]